MSLLHDGAFMAHLSQSKVEAKQQVNRMIDAIYAKVMLDLELWLNKHENNEDNDFSRHQLGVNRNDATSEPMQLPFPNTQFKMQQNVISPPSLPSSHLQSHSNDFRIKSEIESNCEENVTENNLPGESPNWQPTPPEPLQATHSVTPQTTIIKKEFVDDDEDNQDEFEFDSQVTQNVQSVNDLEYLPTNNEIYGDFSKIENNGIPEFYSHEVSNRLSTNTQQPKEYNHERIHFEDDLEIDQETLDQVKREIEEEENMKRRENEGEVIREGGDMRPYDEGGRMESDQSEDTQASIENSDNCQHNSDESLVIQQHQNDTNNEIEDDIESITNPTQPNNTQSNHHFHCAHCSKSFAYRCRLEQHVRVHTGERPFQCGQCGKHFSQTSGLAQHKRIHQNIKGFHCDQCDKQFVQKAQLDSHRRTHSGERPFQCRFCELTFIELGTRRTHEQAKHLHVKPYQCKECGLTSTQQSNIISHIRVLHFGLPATIKEQRERNIIDHRDPREMLEKV